LFLLHTPIFLKLFLHHTVSDNLTVRIKRLSTILTKKKDIFWAFIPGTYPVLCAYSIFCQKIRSKKR